MSVEAMLREKLAAAHHVVHYSNWDDLLATHLSARIPNTEHLLITPMNVPFEEVCASNLIKCDFNGKIISDNGQKLMPQAINIHGEIYKHSSTIMSAMHTHSIYGVAVSSLEAGLLFMNQQSLRFYNDVAYHPFDGLALRNEGEEIVKSLGNKKVMILRNHGLLTTGRSIEVAMYLLHYLEVVCKIQIKTLSSGETIVYPSKELSEKTKLQFDSILSPEFEFETLTRRIAGRSRVDYKS
ncbi:MAG: class II aldolase/adducin family protein [Pseudomonadota bacterium]